MQYFAEATDILQRDNIPTCNRVILAVDSLENAIKGVNRENAAINAMCEALRNSLERSFSYLLQSVIHRAATALDRQVKLAFTKNTTDGKFFIFQSTTVKKNIQELLPESTIHSGSTLGPITNSRENAAPQPPKKKKLLDFSSFVPTNSSVNEINIELQTYFDSPVLKTEPITFWSSTELSTLALQLLSVPCISASVERLCSKAGFVLIQRRT